MKHTIAIVGCGRIAGGAHFPALTKLDNVHIKYACDLIPEKAQALVDKYSLDAKVITDYNIALADPEVEAVWVLTPNFAHYTVTMDALRAGKHVMCEKPVTVNYEMSCEMAAEADKQGKLLNIGVCNRYHESVIRLEQMAREGKFGNIYHVVCSFRAFRSIPGLGGAFTTKAQSGGGALIDWGIHYLDLILYILGSAKLKTVTCDTYCEMAKDMKSYRYTSMWAEDTKDVENGVNDVDDFVTGHVRTDKASISLNGAWAQNVDKGDTWVDFLGDKAGARLTYGGQFTFTDGSTLETTASSHDIPNMYLREDEDFLKSIETGVKNRNNVDNILESMKLLDALYKSAEEKREIAL
ncbi:MAG: Gfo/Idh/MocA family oxidoreductase [Ruminococcaceae bacterium]|nr:Gfo/Idh/MocA family oxidoreductase [Oscillospiraceae bacterium]